MKWSTSLTTRWLVYGVVITGIPVPHNSAQDVPLRQQAEQALRQAVAFFHGQVASYGGYVWRYSADLEKREGEGKADTDTVWVQPPGTPTVGMAYLEAYQRTGHDYLLAAAKDAADCLIRGQLRSGGWSYSIEFAPQRRTRYAYRADTRVDANANNTTILDDNTTQSALQFLMRLDSVLKFQDARIREAVQTALDSLLQAQYPNGAWPQRFSEFPDPTKYPVLPASYPENWSKQYTGERYASFYTLNDSALMDTMETMLLAHSIYGDARYLEAARRAGDFLILAQMPEPQPAWAQQYDVQMHPAWARRFEPPAITGGESQSAIRALLQLYEETGDRKYLQPIPRALDYLKRSLLPNGQLARFYELQTNRPLYFTRTYELTYDDTDLPTHYAFKVRSNLETFERQYRELLQLMPSELEKRRQARYTPSRSIPSSRTVRAILEQLDDRGAWVEQGRLRNQGSEDRTTQIISSATFVRNVDLLSRYLAQR